MVDQLDLFDAPPPLPEGFKYQDGIITAEAERTLLEAIHDLPFKEFEFHGYIGKRRTVSFGGAYDFASEELRSADDMPPFLLNLREIAAAFAESPLHD